MADQQSKPERVPRDLRYRQQLFPGSDDLVFDVRDKGFVPVPIILRKLLRRLSAPELRVLASRHCICYPTVEEMVHELGLTSRKNLMPHLQALEYKRFISSKTNAGRIFFLVHNPRVAIRHLLISGQMSEDDLMEINQLYEDLNQEQVRPAEEQSRTV